MLKRCALILMSAVVLCGAAAVAADVDITGTWTASFDTQIGKQDYTYEFVVKDSVLTGEAKSNSARVRSPTARWTRTPSPSSRC